MIDVVVVAYRSAGVIDRCLAAARDIPGLGRLVVVDHGDDGTAEVARDLGAAVIADPSNPGFGAGQNRGFTATTAEYVLLLNPDAEVRGAAVARGAELLAARPEVALVQGVVASADGGEPERSRGRELAPVHLWGRALGLRRLVRIGAVRALARRLPSVADHVDRTPTNVEDVEWLAATVVLARRAALDAVDGFDNIHYFLYGEDLDLCRRLRAGGWTLVAVPEQWATHMSGASSASSWDRELEWWRGTMTFAARSWQPSAYGSAQAAAFVRWLRLTARRPASAARAWTALIGDGRRARRSRAFAPTRPLPTPPSARRP
ncbi:MAG: N-acetylglucosaminyl-diphospho-decaprenol L-rhamnosyltransferase [Actinomycetota bacterium]|jgi:GT2 family glycosyltransferase